MKLSKRGLTLVELLIVLMILAGLVTSVAVSASGAQDRRRAAETQRLGKDIAAAWDRGDGLSFVSDFGEAPHSAALLQLLFRDEYPAQFKRNPAVANRPDPGFAASNMKRAPGFRMLHGKVTDIDPVAGDPDSGSVAVKVPKVIAAFEALPEIEIYGGWRGPYCSEKMTYAANVATDGFGGAWLLLNRDGKDIHDPSLGTDADRQAAVLCSYGQDRMKDAAGTKKTWQTRDVRFSLRTPQPTLTLDLDVDSTVDMDTLELHVYVYAPKADWKFGAGSRKDDEPTVSLSCRYYSVKGNSSLSLSEGLTVGSRAVFVWAKDAGSQYFYLPPRYLTLVPGNNTLKGTLRKAN